MRSLLSGLARAASQGVLGYEEGKAQREAAELARQRELVAMAAKRRQEEREQLQTIGRLRESGIVPASEAQDMSLAIPQVGGGLPGAMAPQPVTVPKAGRYTPAGKIGETEFVTDTLDTPSARRRGAAEQEAQRRKDEAAERRRQHLEDIKARQEQQAADRETRLEIARMARDAAASRRQDSAERGVVVQTDEGPRLVSPTTGVARPITDPSGQQVSRPSPTTGGASLQKAVAKNEEQLSVIDDALSELDKYPKAVGLKRGIPVIGDRLDPRADPQGVAARASIANIGSLQIHDRSGAAVSVHEFPRLAPFIPSIHDPPEAIRTKLRKLKQAISVETEALRQSAPRATAPSGTPAASPAPPSGDIDLRSATAAELWDAAVAKHGRAKVLAEYGPRPE